LFVRAHNKVLFVRAHNATQYLDEFESIRANPKQKVFKTGLFGNQVCLYGDVLSGDSMGTGIRSYTTAFRSVLRRAVGQVYHFMVPYQARFCIASSSFFVWGWTR
jgi:hypothetical protein